MNKILIALIFVAGFAVSTFARAKEEGRIEDSGLVIGKILNIRENIPKDLLSKAKCVVIIPSVLKFAFGVGESYGRGVMTCGRGADFTGSWSYPSMMALEGGSFGFQLGGQAADLVLLLMNSRAASGVLTSKVKLGGDAAASLALLGRNASASTDATLRAEILSYSRSRGLFAGVSLEGSTLRPDNKANHKLYGRELNARDIVLKSGITPPPAADNLLDTLNKHSPVNRASNLPCRAR